ncbi:glutaredoxin-1 [Schizopora paradoxa]|uniref:glutathione peroxidase n=1 Tax=Schizopora paradoxa TaxID=27342 RepID=A0A0H2RDT2_9AGAM|nr:glutaredoxin-1 [Schizopora paradoxa]
MTRADIKERVDKIIEENKVAVFSKSYCPYCMKAKKLLQNNYSDVQTTVLELDTENDGAQIQDYLQEKSGQRTVPNIFIGQKHIGGSSDLADLENEGKLKALMA